MVKVLQINSVYDFGSTGRIVKNIHDFLLKQGDESYVIYGRKSRTTDKNVYCYQSKIGTVFHACLALLFDTHGLHSTFNTFRVIKQIKKINPDVVHLHNIHGFYLNYKILFQYLKKSNLKVVWTLHDCWAFTGYCAYYDYNECDGWKSGCQQCKYKNTYPYRLLFSRSHKNLKLKKALLEKMNLTLVVPSNWLKSQVEESILKQHVCKVIHNDVKLDEFYFEQNDYRTLYHLENKKILLFVANVWTNPKGYQEVLKFSKRIDSRYQIVMVGLNQKQLKKLPGNILGIQRCQIQELRKWYSTADVMINFTLEDNYPTVNLEAKACGLPIITYRTGGSIEMVEGFGEVVDRYDQEKVLELLETMDFSKKEVKSENHMLEQYYELYKELEGGRK